MNYIYPLLCLICVSFLTACSSNNAPEPIPLTLVLNAGENINPSELSSANPVVIRIYQLSSIDDFKNAQVLDLYQKDTQLLANSLTKKQNLNSVLPKEQRTLPLSIQPGTKYLAVFAQFSNYPQAKSKAWLDVSKIDELASITLSIESLSVNIQAVLTDSFWSW